MGRLKEDGGHLLMAAVGMCLIAAVLVLDLLNGEETGPLTLTLGRLR